MVAVFASCKKLTSIDLTHFDTSPVKNMERMFDGCNGLLTVDVSSWETPNVESFFAFFSGCSQITSIDISNFDTSKAKSFHYMFNDCSRLYNLTLGTPDTSAVENMQTTFQGCSSLKSLDLSNWSFASVTKTNAMFNGCRGLTSISLGTSTSPHLVETESMFKDCESLTSVDLSNFDFTGVTNTKSMFLYCRVIQNITFGNIVTPSLKYLDSMFKMCHSLKYLDLSKFAFNNVLSMQETFFECLNLDTLVLENVNTQSLENSRALFQKCTSLTSMDLTEFDFSKVTDMGAMFKDCKIIEKIKFGDKQISSVIKMAELFSGCEKLESIDLSKFETSKVNDISHLFENCQSLPSIDISNFDTSFVVSMDSMFNGCYNLSNLNLGKLNTSSVQNMHALFQRCFKLGTIDLTSWDTSQVTTMEAMFFGCSLFKFLNLSNLVTPNIESVKDMFNNANSLIYLNLYSFLFNDSVEWESIFFGLDDNVIYCIHDNSTRYLILAPERYCFCDDHCFLINFTKIDFNNERCLDSCLKSPNNKYEYNSVCYNKCPDNTILDDFQCIDNYCIEDEDNEVDTTKCVDGKPIGYYFDTNDNVYKQCYQSCQSCNGEGTEEDHNCEVCKPNYTFMRDEANEKNCYPICEKYYFFDTSNKHHCTDEEVCPSDYNILIDQKGKCIDHCERDNKYKYEYRHKCYEEEILEPTTHVEQTTHVEPTTNAETTTHVEPTTNAETTTHVEPTTNPETTNYVEPSTNVKQPIEEKETTNKENIKEETTHLENKIKETTYRANEVITTTEEKSSNDGLYECLNENSLIDKCYLKDDYNDNEKLDLIKSNILSGLSSNNFKSLSFEGANARIQITNNKNENNLLRSDDLPDDYNFTIIDLGQCEALLKQKYNIAEGDSLIILKKETLVPKSIEYEIYEPYNKTKLNISICSGVNINVYEPLVLSDETKKMAEELEEMGYNMFNINDRFYKDYCTLYTSSDNTDMILSDRVDHIYNNNDAQCQENCEFSNYIFGSKYVNCTCNVDHKIESASQVKKIDKMDYKKFMQSFWYVLKYSNYKILKCYKLVFVKSVFTKNKGAIIIFILFILYLMCLIAYICQGIKPLQNSMQNLIEDNARINTRKSTATILFPPKKRKSSVKPRKPKDSAKILNKYDIDKKIKFEQEPKKPNSKSPFFSDKKKKEKPKQYNSTKEIVVNREKLKKRKSKYKTKSKIDRKESEEDLSSETNIQPRKYDDFELNELPYEEAVQLDHRSCWRVYLSFLRREHRIIFTFFVCNDYNLIPVKLSRFIFLLATDMAMNVFFFSDATMHKIFLNYGKYNFVQQIAQILYSSILSQIIEVFLCFLSLTDSQMYEIKDLTFNSKNIKQIKEAFAYMKRKLFFYWLFTFICFLGYWYIVAVFCAVYVNTQIIFIKDSLMSVLLSSIYPLILYMFPSCFRVCSLKCKNNNCLFKFSQIIPFF
ncbi:MAG: BspA family leucine-rich repeat surface protein [Clostridia bacterium]|nr:BspA family leucine-rich repeat surface protein [Clostridia bacterium]